MELNATLHVRNSEKGINTVHRNRQNIEWTFVVLAVLSSYLLHGHRDYVHLHPCQFRPLPHVACRGSDDADHRYRTTNQRH